TLRLHLLLHGLLDVAGRRDVLELDAVDLRPPLIRGVVENELELRVDDVAGSEGLVEIHLAAHVTERGLRELAHGQRQVRDFVRGADRVDDLDVEQRIDADRHVVLGDDRLLGNVENRFAQVDARGAPDAAVGDPDQLAGRVEERNDHVQTAREGPGGTPQPLDDHALALLDDAEPLREEHESEEYDEAQKYCHGRTAYRGLTVLASWQPGPAVFCWWGPKARVPGQRFKEPTMTLLPSVARILTLSPTSKTSSLIARQLSP